VVAGIVFGFVIARSQNKGAGAPGDATGKAEAQREVVALGERLAAKEARLIEVSRDHMDAKRRLEEALDHASRLNANQQKFDAHLAEIRKQAEERVASLEDSHGRALEALRAGLRDKIAQAEKRAAEESSRAEAAAREAQSLKEEVAALEASRSRGDGMSSAVNEAQARLASTFRALSAEALRQNSQAFLDLARTVLENQQGASPRGDGVTRQAIDDAVKPLRESLTRIAGSIAGIEKERSTALAGLAGQVETLIAGQQEIRSETQGLSASLRGPLTRGHWGEMQLRRTVELSGMIEHCDFEAGPAPSAMVIHLPNQRTVVVDASVSLTLFSEGLESIDATTRASKFRQHAAAVREHLRALSSDAYWSQFPARPEMVVAFMPGESAFSAAFEHDPTLLEFGAPNRVILATPATLIALLKAAAHGWQQQRLIDNAREISLLGQTLYENLQTYQTRMDEVRENLDRTVDSFNRASSTLDRDVCRPARQLQSANRGEPGAAAHHVAIRPPEPLQTEPEKAPAEELAAVKLLSDAPETDAIDDIELFSEPFARESLPPIADLHATEPCTDPGSDGEPVPEGTAGSAPKPISAAEPAPPAPVSAYESHDPDFPEMTGEYPALQHSSLFADYPVPPEFAEAVTREKNGVRTL
jgi:DNA recombination protein RmuC